MDAGRWTVSAAGELEFVRGLEEWLCFVMKSSYPHISLSLSLEIYNEVQHICQRCATTRALLKHSLQCWVFDEVRCSRAGFREIHDQATKGSHLSLVLNCF